MLPNTAAASARRHVDRVDDRRRRQRNPGSMLPLSSKTRRACLARPDFGQRPRSAGERRRERSPRRQQPRRLDCLVPQGVRLGAPLTETQKDFGKLAYFPGEPVILAAPAGGAGSRTGLPSSARPGRLPTSHARLRGGNQEVQTLRHETWFGQKVAWFDAGKLKACAGVIGQ